MAEPRFVRAARIVLTTALLLGMAAYAFRGVYTRYVTDDYCTAAAWQNKGFVKAMQYHRSQWSGRFSYYAIKAGVESIGPGTARVVPALMMVLLAVAAAWTIGNGLSLPRALSITAACAIAFADVHATPDAFSIFGPFVWETGALTYMLPVVLFTIWAGLLFGPASLIHACIASVLVMFIAGGLSETSLSAQGMLTGGAFALALLHHNRRQSWIAGTGLLATIASLAVVLSAPGNALRASTLPPRPSLLDIARMTTGLAYDFIGSHIFVDGAALLVVVVVGILCGRIVPVRPAVSLQVSVLAILCYIATFLPSAWVLSTSPPPRALQVSTFFLIATVFTASMAIRVGPAFLAASLIVIAILPVLSTLKTLRTIPEARRDAAIIDAIGRELRPQRGRHVVLRSRWAIEQRFLADSPTHWTNRCMGLYFGLKSLRVTR